MEAKVGERDYDTFRIVNWYPPRDDFWSTVWVKLFYLWPQDLKLWWRVLLKFVI